MTDLLDWAERAGIENLRGRRENAESLIKEGTTALTLLLAGATGALAYALRDGGDFFSNWSIGAIAFSLYLYILCLILVIKVIWAQDLPPLYNEPKHLYQKDFEVTALREVELGNIQRRIDEATRRNVSVSKWVNGVRFAAALGPLVFAAAAILMISAHPFAQERAGECTAFDYRAEYSFSSP